MEGDPNPSQPKEIQRSMIEKGPLPQPSTESHPNEADPEIRSEASLCNDDAAVVLGGPEDSEPLLVRE